jgi:hypothetical protein
MQYANIHDMITRKYENTFRAFVKGKESKINKVSTRKKRRSVEPNIVTNILEV